MRKPRRPVFLARNPYRMRRLRDAARLLPVFGAFLMILPVMWSPPDQALRVTSGDVVYFFLIWTLLVLVAAGFAPGLAEQEDIPEDQGDSADDGGG
ncbi:MAG: hypothetical protein WAT09_08035 [Paracoccaceae bacterium]